MFEALSELFELLIDGIIWEVFDDFGSLFGKKTKKATIDRSVL